MLNFRQIEVFHATMVAKTVSGAARMLNTSQPGLSRMLKHMESRLGLTLFDRSTGRLEPTREALVLFENLQQVHKGINNLDLVIQRLRRGGDLSFRVGGSPSIGHAIMPRALATLRCSHPNLLIHYDTLSVNQVEDYLALGQGEYALTVFPVDHPNVVSTRIGEARIVCITAPGAPPLPAGPIALADIADQPLVSFQADTPHGAVIEAMYLAAGLQRRVDVFVRFAETACAFVEQGLGVALVDAFSARSWGRPAHTHPVRGAGALPTVLNRSGVIARSGLGVAFENIVERLVADEKAHEA